MAYRRYSQNRDEYSMKTLLTDLQTSIQLRSLKVWLPLATEQLGESLSPPTPFMKGKLLYNWSTRLDQIWEHFLHRTEHGILVQVRGHLFLELLLSVSTTIHSVCPLNSEMLSELLKDLLILITSFTRSTHWSYFRRLYLGLYSCNRRT